VTIAGCRACARRPFQPRDRRWCGFGCSVRMPGSERNRLTSRRHLKNSGGGIAPAAIGGLIEGLPCSVNVSGPPPGPEKAAGKSR